jgi:hypothetical protein
MVFECIDGVQQLLLFCYLQYVSRYVEWHDGIGGVSEHAAKKRNREHTQWVYRTDDFADIGKRTSRHEKKVVEGLLDVLTAIPKIASF